MSIERLLGLKASTVLQSIARGQNKESVNTGEASKLNLETHGGSSKASNLCHKDLGLSKLFYLLIMWPLLVT